MQVNQLPEFKDKGHLLMLDQTTDLEKACKEMKKYNYGSVLVTHKGKLSGIFTERDLLMKVAAKGENYKKLALKDVMTKKVQTANENYSIGECVQIMSDGNFRHLPVLDDKGNISGMLSQKDFIILGWDQLMDRLKRETKESFVTHTQLWVLALGVMTYVTCLFLLF